MLSGYLIARPFARAYVGGTRRPRLRSYVRNRVLRVVPVFYLFTVLVLLRFGLDGTLETGAARPRHEQRVAGRRRSSSSSRARPAARPSIPIGPAWSIGAEVGFYFVIPIAAWLAMRTASRLEGPAARGALAIAAAGA